MALVAETSGRTERVCFAKDASPCAALPRSLLPRVPAWPVTVAGCIVHFGDFDEVVTQSVPYSRLFCGNEVTVIHKQKHGIYVPGFKASPGSEPASVCCCCDFVL